jgi:serine/threonine-protein kinase
MGEVLAATDLKIGRDIAIKRMHGTPSPRAVNRFLREARVQARLQHPAIVPVHDLGTDKEGRLFFTMKRLSGDTLADRITETAEIGPLLRAFVEVLLAIDFAHTREVVHRDLKPANIMLGEFGEVYVLDWGVARDLAERDEVGVETDASTSDPLSTRAGAVLGTPGYMSPEQVRGEPVGTASDIYALGAILFEILTAEPLHPRGELALMATLTGDVQSPAARRPDRAIAPELDALCLAAQAEDPDARPSAREMAERLRKYIDGDRDHERRRALAAEQLAAARAALDSDSPDGRALAMRHAGRALALDPESTEAADFVGRLVLEKPAVMPPALVASLDERDRDAIRKRSRRAAMSYGAVFGFLAVIPFLEIRSWPWLIAFYAALAAIVAFALGGVRTGRVSPHVSMLLNGVVAIVATRIASPFILAPVMICGALIAVASHPWNQQRPWTIFAWATTVVGLPFVLEAAGVLERTWLTTEGSLRITSTIYAIHGNAEAAVLITANLAFVLLLGAFALTITRTRRDAERELHIQAWHLRQLIPERR